MNTIIVIIILATAVILSLSQNNPIQKSSEAVFKSDLTAIKDSLSLYIASEYYAKGLLPDTLDSNDISGVIGFSQYKDKFIIKDGVLYCTNKVTATERASCTDLGVKQIVYINNLIQNGNFYNGTNAWVAQKSVNSAASNTLTNVGNGADSAPYTYSNSGPNKITGHKYYSSLKIRVTNPNCSFIRVRYFEVNVADWIYSSPIQNAWYSYGFIIIATSGTPLNPYIFHKYADAATANNKVMEVQNVLVVDLTEAFGSGNEPSVEEMNLIPFFTKESGSYEYIR